MPEPKPIENGPRSRPLPPLPIDVVLAPLVEALSTNACAVLQAPAGAGKTSRVPLAMLDASLAGAGQIVLLQPRRLAARAAAARLAAERGCRLGSEIGYQVRFDRQASAATRVLAVTDGIFVRMLQDDPLLESIGAVIFDEFHERSLNTDLALAMVRRVQTEVRPELKIVVMSATLQAEPIARYLGGCPVVRSEGRLFPVAVEYLRYASQGPLPQAAAQAVERALTDSSGDILAFLPGVAEIRKTADLLAGLAATADLEIRQLYGDLPLDEQQAVLQPAARRKVVLSTNVAETSLTIEGITAVVDSGLARVLRLDPALGLNRLETVRISRASADQRAGRAGRTAPGLCLRLWTERDQRGLAEHETPEILRVDLSGPVLELLGWGERDLAGFGWYEPPPPQAIEQALALLRRLGAIDQRGITDLGRQMARLPVHPRIGRLLLEGRRTGRLSRLALAGALLSERNPFRQARDEPCSHASDSDILDRLSALEAFERSGRRESEVGRLESGAGRFILRARDQLRRIVEQEAPQEKHAETDPDEAVGRALLAAFPDRLARRREPGGDRAIMIGGRGVRLAKQSAVTQAELFVCVDLEEIGKPEALVRQASAVERSWLEAGRLATTIDVEFDAVRERVVAIRRTRVEDLVLDEAITGLPAGYDASELLAHEAAARLDRSLRLDESAEAFLARVRCLRQWIPELDLPDFGDDPLRTILPTLCIGRQSFDELRRAPALAAVKAMLTLLQLQALDREAPERLQVPSGSLLPLRYEAGQPPVLAVRIQELFGWRETPRIARGRVAVLLHLLGPNMRPQQVTGDLDSFWRNAYPLVRKELKRRYPKHAWPEDPWTAVATRGAARRGK
ncbi:MAG TPA: ATP-dependent helicase HrpB [Pirellulales bacterium]|nr:ATP-dependent helicase HrpB [Pirellulales bacterium]